MRNLKSILLGLSLVGNLVLAATPVNEVEPQIQVKEVMKKVEVPVVETKVVEKIVEVPVEKTIEKVIEVDKTNSKTELNNKETITATVFKNGSGSTTIDFSDFSWAVIDEENNEYIFQPALLGEYDVKLDNLDQLKECIEIYFADNEIIVNNISDTLDQTPENAALNPDKILSLENELNKVPTSVKKLLIDNGVEIFIQDDWESREGEDKIINGTYFWDSRGIILNGTDNSIESAAIHELGHALDHIFNIGANEKIAQSFKSNEVTYENNHFHSSVTEYIAECISEYYNDTLDKDTIIYNELNAILSNI